MGKSILALAAMTAMPALASAADKPNVLIVVTHDRGDAATSRTPNRDAWAARGATFANAYSAATQPGPAHVALLTGRYPQRLGFELDPDPAAEGPAKLDVPQPTLAQSFKAAGYATGAFGNEPADTAAVGQSGKGGFDEVKLTTDSTLDGAAAFIGAHASQPFLAYLSLSGAAPDLDGKLAQVGSILHDHNLDANTVLVLVQEHQGSTWSLHANEIRATWVLVRPGTIPAARVVAQNAAAVDLAPTILAAAGVPVTADGSHEGVNLYPAIQNPDSAPADHPLFWRLGPQYGVQQGNWRLLKSNAAEKHPRLYDVSKDPAEHVDLAAANEKQADALQAQWTTWNGGNQAPRWTDFRADGQPDEAPDPVASAAHEFGPLKADDSLQGTGAPAVANKAIDVSAEFEFNGSDGVILSQGAGAQGYAVYVLNGKLEFAVREDGSITSITANDALKSGSYTVQATLKGEGKLTLLVNGTQVAEGNAPGLIPKQPKTGLFVGRAGTSAVGNNATPGVFGGHVRSVKVKVG